MPLPENVALLKIHPAIGIARVSPSPDYFVFGETDNAFTYKTDGVIMRQAVRFFLVGYDTDGHEVARLDPAALAAAGLGVRWRVRVANKKVARLRGSPHQRLPDADLDYAITAEAASDRDGGMLSGNMTAGDYDEGRDVPLGRIHPDGVYEPGQGSVFRADAGAPLPPNGMHSPVLTDNTCDGVVSADVFESASGQAVAQPVLDAWLLVAPPDFSPDFLDSEIYRQQGRPNLDEWLADRLGAPVPVNQTARDVDRATLRQGTSDFHPGIESSLGTSSYGQDVPDLGDLFLDRAANGDLRLDPVRLSPGDLTAYLCSPWQYDFRPCACNYWAAQRPDVAMREGTVVKWLRRRVASGGQSPAGGTMSSSEDFVHFTPRLGVIRKINGIPTETERTDDVPDDGIA